MPIFRVRSVKIYTGQKKFTRVYPWEPLQIWGMILCVLFILAQFFQSYGGAFMSVPQSRAPRLVVLTREGFVGDATTIARCIKYIRFFPPAREYNMWLQLSKTKWDACLQGSCFCQHKSLKTLLNTWDFLSLGVSIRMWKGDTQELCISTNLGSIPRSTQSRQNQAVQIDWG